MKAYTYAGDGTGKFSEGEVPAEPDRRRQQGARSLIEMVAEADEALMEKFFEAGTLTQDELIKGLAAATRDVKIYPLVCTSGLREHRRAAADGRDRRVSALARRSPVHGDGQRRDVAKPADEKAPFAAFVFKTLADQFAGRISMFRVYQGCLKADSTRRSTRRRARRNASAT